MREAIHSQASYAAEREGAPGAATHVRCVAPPLPPGNKLLVGYELLRKDSTVYWLRRVRVSKKEEYEFITKGMLRVA